MYAGTDVRGKKVPPGYTLDWSDDGNCSDCHAPIAVAANRHDLQKLTSLESSGVACDYCHKIEDVQPDPDFGVRRIYPGTDEVPSATWRMARQLGVRGVNET